MSASAKRCHSAERPWAGWPQAPVGAGGPAVLIWPSSRADPGRALAHFLGSFVLQIAGLNAECKA